MNLKRALEPSSSTNALSAESAMNDAVDAYLYGFPLVTMDMTRKQTTNVDSAGPTESAHRTTHSHENLPDGRIPRRAWREHGYPLHHGVA